MTQIDQLFQQSELALAAYANLTAGVSIEQFTAALKVAGMAQEQAADFANRYTVIDQFSDSTGLSATVLQDQNGKCYLAVRGTQSAGDFIANAYILAGWPSFLNPQFFTLKAQVQLWMNSGVLSSNYTITGHSLGGYLAAALGSWFRANNAGTFLLNAPGVGGLVGNAADSFRAAIGLGSVALVGNINNIRASSGPSLISGLGTQLALPVFIETEFNANPFANHSIVTITDSLAVFDLLDRLKPGISLAEAGAIVRAASSQNADTLESVVNALSEMFCINVTAPVGNRDQLYQVIYAIEALVPTDGTSPLRLVSLVNQSSDSIVTAAQARSADALAYRYALKELNPFIVIGADLYSPFNDAGQLELYDPASGSGCLTDLWLGDRAAMLGWVIKANREDRIDAINNNVSSVLESYTFRDLASGTTLFVRGGWARAGNNPTGATPFAITFGTDAGETITGTNVDVLGRGDHLYGGGGADTLIGNGGSDYLEGGQGIDTYVYSSGDGQDTILDTDGLGMIVFNGVTLTGGARLAPGAYISGDKQFRYVFQGDLATGGTLVINGDLRIENFRNGDLGITLGDPGSLAEIQPTTHAYIGGITKDDYVGETRRQDISLYGSEGNDLFIASHGLSVFLGKAGDDLLEGNGLDYLIGGAGDDVITAGEYFEFGRNTGLLVLSGGAGSDIILGGQAAENIYGDMEQAVISPEGNSFYIDQFWFNSETAFGELFDGQFANAQFDNPLVRYDSDYAFASDQTIYFFSGIAEALNYILGISASTDLSTLYDDFIDGGGGNDRIWGGFGSDTLIGGEGNDQIVGDGGPPSANLGIYANLFGLPGDDYLDGGGGNDTLIDRDGGNDTFVGGNDNDTITSIDPLNGTIASENYLEGDDGNDVLSSDNRSVDGFDTLLGGAGNDALSSIYGNVFLDGGPGNDIYAISRGHVGQITIQEHDNTPGNLDRLVFGTLRPVYGGEGEGGVGNLDASWDLVDGILPSEVGITRDQSNLYLSVDGVPDTVTLLNWFVSDADRIEQVLFQDGTVWDVAKLTAMATSADPVYGTADDDYLVGIDGIRNSLSGDAGDDTLAGGNADDVLNGGAGDDFLAGGAGDDTYVFNPHDGIDHIQDDAGTNTLQFGAGIAPSILTLGLGSLLIHVGSGGDAIHLDDFDPGDVFGIHTIDSFRFDDGTNLTYSQLVARGFDITGTNGDDLLTGTNVNDRFDGGPGNDRLIGGAGNDTYLFGRGSGQDQIQDVDATVGNSDTLRVGAGVAPDDLLVSRINDDLLIKIQGTQDQVAITNWFLGGSNGIERVQFSDGTTWDAATLESHIAGAPVNHPPVVANPIIDQAANEDAPFRFQIPANTFVDVDTGDVLRFTATLANGSALPYWLTFDAATRSFNGTPANGDVGTVQVSITATDSGNASVSDTFDLTVINTNDAPFVAHDIAPRAATEDAAFSFTVPADVFADEDVGDTLSYLASRPDGSALPTWLTFNAATRTFSGTPGNGDVGTHQVRITATDSGNASVSTTFDLTVTNTNDAPVVAHGMVPQAATEDAAFSFTVPADVFADEDVGDTLSYLASRPDGSALPAWLTFNAATRTFSGIPGNGDVGAHQVRITATDSGNASVSTTFDLTVSNTNDAPVVAHGIVPQAATEDAAFSFTVPADVFADEDVGDTLSYLALRPDGSALPAWLTFNAATRTFSGTPGNGDVGTHQVRITATDSGNASVSTTFDLTVTNTNDAPVVAHGIVPQAATEDAAFSFTVPADVFADEDVGDTLSYLASRPDGSALPAWLTFNAATRTFSGIPGNDDVSALNVTLVAMDAANASASTVFTISITSVNDAPVLNHAIVDQFATVGSTFVLPLSANTFTDIDVGDTLTYSARLLDGSSLPGWLAFDVATRSFNGTPDRGDAGVYSIRVTATDSGNLSAFDIFGLTVAAAPGQDLVGTISNDVLTGGAGDDTLNGGGGSDRLLGNGGNDTFQYFSDATWSAGIVVHNDGNPGNPGTGRVGALSGMNRSFDVFQGGAGDDVLIGTSGDDALFLDDPNSPFPSGSESRIAGIERIEMGEGDDIVDLISSYYAYVDVTLDGGDGNDMLWASSGDDVLLGGAGNDDLFGGAGRDYLSGGRGNDTINGGGGNDLLEGGDGNDALSDAFGSNLFYAGSGNDKAIGGGGNELFIGGKGNDTIVTGQGADIIAFNRGDGHDTIAEASSTSSTTVDNTLSLGGGIRYQDLYLSQQGNSLVLDAGNQDRITLQNWYSSPASRGVLNLQMVAAAMNDFAPAGGDPLRDNGVERFDFQSIVRQFDQARIADPSVNRWAVMNALLDAHLGGSDTEALGGDLAYRYGLSGSLEGIGTGAAQDVLADAQFGSGVQALRPLGGLQEGLVRLG